MDKFSQRTRLLASPDPQVDQDKQRTSPWMPFTLQPAFLSALLVVTVCLFAAVETIRQVSLRDDAVVIVNKNGQVPPTLTFMYLYFPVLASVIYGLAWAWVDLDIKRLEPYFQLSKHDGAAAEDSLLLTYPHDFLPLVPIHAARRRYGETAQLPNFWPTNELLGIGPSYIPVPFWP